MKYSQVSRLQFPLLREFAELQPGSHIPVARAAKFDQRPLCSLYHRGWIGLHPGKGFYLTREGIDAYNEYMVSESRKRLNPDRPLSHYFDPVAYQLERPEKKKVVHHAAA